MDAMKLLQQLGNGEVTYGLNKYVNPKKDAKFSPNMYKYLTYNSMKCFVKVYQDSETGNRFYMGNIQAGSFMGAKLMAIFCYGSQAETFAYMPSNCKGFKDVTEWFWNKYFEVGKAIYDLPEFREPHYKIEQTV